MYRGSILHRRGRENSTNFEGGQSRPPLQRAMMKRNVFRFSPRRGRCLHRPARKRPFYGGFPANPCWFAISCRRGGIVRFYGNPMRIRKISMGRCGHRPLQTTTKIQLILRADRVVRPYKKPRKTQRFSASRRRGRCPHRPAGNVRFMAVFRRIGFDFPFYTVGAELSGFMEIRCESATF